MNAMSNEQDFWSGWQERLSDPGTTLPSQPPVVKGDPVAVGFVIFVAVIVLCVLVGWLVIPERIGR